MVQVVVKSRCYVGSVADDRCCSDADQGAGADRGELQGEHGSLDTLQQVNNVRIISRCADGIFWNLLTFHYNVLLHFFTRLILVSTGLVRSGVIIGQVAALIISSCQGI